MRQANLNKRKIQFNKVFQITVGWTLISVFQYFSHHALMREMHCAPPPGLDPLMHFNSHVFTGVLAGLAGGSVIVFLWENWLRTKTYGWMLVSMFLSYSAIFVGVAIFSGLFFRSVVFGQSLLEPAIWQAILRDFFTFIQLYSYLLWLLIVLSTLIVMLVNDKYGPGVFRAFLLGKYFHPKREERIFMFLDLRSSTTIAEKLGDERYFNFINDVFKFATPAIIYSKGEIYQYIGDEIIISWDTESGARNANCLNCFFEIQNALQQKSAYFESHYQVQPEFKAGLHYGFVIAGEVGIVKRDIAFSGDVLNTTARIQSKCNDLGVNILVSKLLMDQIDTGSSGYSPRPIGNMELRGKTEKVALFTV